MATATHASATVTCARTGRAGVSCAGVTYSALLRLWSGDSGIALIVLGWPQVGRSLQTNKHKRSRRGGNKCLRRIEHPRSGQQACSRAAGAGRRYHSVRSTLCVSCSVSCSWSCVAHRAHPQCPDMMHTHVISFLPWECRPAVLGIVKEERPVVPIASSPF